MLRNAITPLGGRRFVLSCATLIISSALVAFEAIGDAMWSAVVIATVGAFIGGDTAQRVMESRDAADH